MKNIFYASKTDEITKEERRRFIDLIKAFL